MSTVASEDLALARIVSQGLADPLADPVKVVRLLCCVQAQDLPGALVSIALRTEHHSLDEVVAAFDQGRLVRSWTMRGTLHVVCVEDLAWILVLTGGRVLSSAAGRHRQLGIDRDVLQSAEEVTRRRLAGGGRATRTELLAVLDDAGLVQGVAQRGVHLLAALSMQGVMVQGPMSRTATGRLEQQFVLLEEWATATAGPADAVAHWAARYVTGHGPVTLDDLVRWTGLTRTACRAGLATAAACTPHTGGPYVADADLPVRLAERRAEAGRLRLLPGFDELVLGYADRSCTVRPEHAEAIVPGNNGMFRNTVVDAGVVVGTWRRPARRGALPVVDWLVTPTRRQLADVAEAAGRLPR